MRPHGAIGIVSLEQDPHALAVRGLVRRDFARDCEIVAVDRLAASGMLDWHADPRVPARLPTLHGAALSVRELGAVWWRRGGAQSQVPERVRDKGAQDQISDDCIDALEGVFRTEFHGAWVSPADATRNSESKLLQLRVAHAAGLRVPRTLVSQVPDSIRAFHAACGGQVVVKPLTTRLNAGVAAGRLGPDLLGQDEVLRLSPAIYQELVPGRRHLRVHVFGEEAHTALIEADDLDWRFNLRQSRLTPYHIDPALRTALVKVLDALGLRMGVFDFKLAPDGSPVWLEVNPQGQFLFVEALCGLPLSRTLAAFLVDAADRAFQVGPSHFDRPPQAPTVPADCAMV